MICFTEMMKGVDLRTGIFLMTQCFRGHGDPCWYGVKPDLWSHQHTFGAGYEEQVDELRSLAPKCCIMQLNPLTSSRQCPAFPNSLQTMRLIADGAGCVHGGWYTEKLSSIILCCSTDHVQIFMTPKIVPPPSLRRANYILRNSAPREPSMQPQLLLRAIVRGGGGIVICAWGQIESK